MGTFTPTLKEGLYVHREPCSAPTYVHIKETKSQFVFTWDKQTLDRYRGTTWYEDCEQSGDWSALIRMSPPSWMWKADDGSVRTTFTIRKSGSQHAISIDETDGRTCWVTPYRNGGICRFDWISDK